MQQNVVNQREVDSRFSFHNTDFHSLFRDQFLTNFSRWIFSRFFKIDCQSIFRDRFLANFSRRIFSRFFKIDFKQFQSIFQNRLQIFTNFLQKKKIINNRLIDQSIKIPSTRKNQNSSKPSTSLEEKKTRDIIASTPCTRSRKIVQYQFFSLKFPNHHFYTVRKIAFIRLYSSFESRRYNKNKRYRRSILHTSLTNTTQRQVDYSFLRIVSIQIYNRKKKSSIKTHVINIP